MASRRLLVGGAGGAFPAVNPPTDASFVRGSHNPIFDGSVAWQGGWVQEPNVLVDEDAGKYKMWFTGGGGAGHYAIGYAECSLADDPTDGANWTQHPTPVIGQGGSGISGDASRICVVKVAATYYGYYSDASANLKVTTSADGKAWGTPSTALAHNAAAFADGWESAAVWNEGGSAWKMLVEAVNGTVTDMIVAATASSDGLTWATPATGTIASLQVTGGTTGGPWLMQFRGAYQLYFHLADNGTGLPTDLYHGLSYDLAAWTITRILTHLGGSSFEHDQVADPSVAVYLGVAYLFYTGANNTGGGAFRIAVATAPATP